MDYYDYKLRRRTADMKPYFSVLAIFLVMLIIGIVGQCDFNDKAETPKLTDAQKSEIMGRQGGIK